MHSLDSVVPVAIHQRSADAPSNPPWRTAAGAHHVVAVLQEGPAVPERDGRVRDLDNDVGLAALPRPAAPATQGARAACE